MPTYRIYYAEREVNDADRAASHLRGGARLEDVDVINHSDWEEEVEARDEVEALESFLREHVRDTSQMMRVDEDGRSQPLGSRDFHPEETYIWIEDGKLMEYQGLEEATPGMVTCPLCDGAGEVDAELAEQFLAEYGEEQEEEEGSWR